MNAKGRPNYELRSKAVVKHSKSFAWNVYVPLPLYPLHKEAGKAMIAVCVRTALTRVRILQQFEVYSIQKLSNTFSSSVHHKSMNCSALAST